MTQPSQVRRPMSPKQAWKRAEALRALSEDASTTEPERDLARRRLREHLERYADDVARWKRQLERKPLRPLAWSDTTPLGDGYHRWRRGDELRPGLWRGLAPDMAEVFVTICTVRKSHRCNACKAEIPKGGRAWRAPIYNGNHRMDRHCTECWAPDPNALPAITEDPCP